MGGHYRGSRGGSVPSPAGDGSGGAARGGHLNNNSQWEAGGGGRRGYSGGGGGNRTEVYNDKSIDNSKPMSIQGRPKGQTVQ